MKFQQIGADLHRGLTPLSSSARPSAGPRGFDSNVQSIASAAHRRGVALMRVDKVVGSIEAAFLCRTLRTAHEATRGDDHAHEHVERLAGGIAAKLGARGAVQVSQSVWNLITGYSRSAKKERG